MVDKRLHALSRHDPLYFNTQPCFDVALPVAAATPRRCAKEMNLKILAITLTLSVSSSATVRSNELETLTESYEREKARVLAPVEAKYQKALEDLLLKYTKAGRLDEATAVQVLLADRNNEGGGDWLRTADTEWRWDSGGVLTLQKNLRALHTKWPKPGKWTRTAEDTIEMIDGYDRKFTVKFKNRGAAAVIGPDGSTTLITILEE